MSSLITHFMNPMPMMLCLLASSCVSLSMWKGTVCNSMGEAQGECRKVAGYGNPIAASLACLAIVLVFLGMSGSGGGMMYGGGGIY